MVTPFPFLHDAVAQPASRSVGEFRTEDQMASRVPDAGSDDPVLVLWMGIGLEAREEPSPHPDRVDAERQRSSNGPSIRNAAGSAGRSRRGEARRWEFDAIMAALVMSKSPIPVRSA
jgi:hypothetical protein